MKKILKKNGFTILEMTLVLTILVLMISSTVVVFTTFLSNQNLNVSSQELVHVLRKSQASALLRLKDSSWGVFIDNEADPKKFVLFQGDTYGVNPGEDEVYELPDEISFSEINLNGGSDEIIFEKATGETDDFGSFEIHSNNDSFQININNLGQVEVE